MIWDGGFLENPPSQSLLLGKSCYTLFMIPGVKWAFDFGIKIFKCLGGFYEADDVQDEADPDFLFWL